MPEIYRPSLARRIASRAAAAIGLRYYDLLLCELELSAARPPRSPGLPLEVRVAAGEDVEAMLALRRNDERRLLEQIARIGRGYAAYSEGRLVGYSWARAGAMHIFCRRPLRYYEIATLPPGFFYTNNSYVPPAFRGRGVFQAMLALQYRDRAAAGFHTAVNLIESVNFDSLAAHRRLGHRSQPARLLKIPGRRPRLTYPGGGPSWRRSS